MTNKTLIFKKMPTGFPVPGEHLVVEDRGFDESAAPPSGGLTLEILCVSFDPYQRGCMRDAEIKTYSHAYQLDGPIANGAVARVLKSDHADYKAGDLVLGFLPTAEYATLSASEVKQFIQRKFTNDHGFKDLGVFIGPLGMPGLTAYSSLYEMAQPKKGETIFVSSAAGAVGMLVGQLAQREGLRVIGSVGSDEKLDFITKELGFDGFNYKKEKPAHALKRLAPEGIEIYYENVGGEHLEAALDAMKDFGRVIASGMISQYNVQPEQRYGVKNLMLVVSKRLTIRGFIVTDSEFSGKWVKEHQENVAKWIAEGSIKVKLHETVGIDHAAEGLVGLFDGTNFGKAVLKIKDA